MSWLDYSSKYFHSLTLTDEDAETVQTLIDAACEYVEKYCNRRFQRGQWDKVYTVSQEGSIVLDNPPIVSIDRLCVASSGWLLVKNTSPTVTNASYSTTGTSLKLGWYAAGVRGTAELRYSQYPTLGSLAAGVSAVGSGWSGTIVSSGKDLFPSVDIIGQQYGNATGTGNTVNNWVDYSGYFDQTMRLPLTEGLYWDWNIENGIVRAYFIPGTKVRAVWTGGFADVPEPLKLATANLVCSAYTGPEGRIKTETLGAYSYTLESVDALAMSDKKTLAYYKDRKF
jgi:hypothetical protein